ncbi:hypothetical protein BLNAU_16103 [Blattamonas nauphoetae]|uniref:Uncharacterized protein n=1 Tax=Blattamonas nauphoetae TaxID=2049346 RepID=A0ABQ9X8V4_9EUKA|nr:hypothetical protein BLNAU_16103 [Blattamonas nauphoetae]
MSDKRDQKDGIHEHEAITQVSRDQTIPVELIGWKRRQRMCPQIMDDPTRRNPNKGEVFFESTIAEGIAESIPQTRQQGQDTPRVDEVLYEEQDSRVKKRVGDASCWNFAWSERSVGRKNLSLGSKRSVEGCESWAFHSPLLSLPMDHSKQSAESTGRLDRLETDTQPSHSPLASIVDEELSRNDGNRREYSERHRFCRKVFGGREASIGGLIVSYFVSSFCFSLRRGE